MTRAHASSLRFSRAWLLALSAGGFALLTPFEAGPIQLLLWQAASVVAIVRFFELGGDAAEGPRFFAGLVLGACAAHLGWRALYLGGFEVEALVGFSVVFLPLGVLASLVGAGGVRGRYGAAAVGALPLASATARLGCFVAGCCHRPGELVSAAGIEVAGAAGLDTILRRVAPDLRLPLALSGLGAVRLASEPFRPVPPLGPPSLPVSLFAFAWILVGVVLARGRRESWT